MNYQKLNAVGTVMIAFITFLAGLIALIYYFFIVAKMNSLNVSVIAIVYIDINLLFLYTLKLKRMLE